MAASTCKAPRKYLQRLFLGQSQAIEIPLKINDANLMRTQNLRGALLHLSSRRGEQNAAAAARTAAFAARRVGRDQLENFGDARVENAGIQLRSELLLLMQ